MRKIKYSNAAISDLGEIWTYTFQNWSRNQANNYLKEIDSKIIEYSKRPDLGRDRIEVKNNYYSFQFISHIIFYTFNKSSFNIVRILHKSMDIKSKL